MAGRRSVSRYRSAWTGSAGWWPRPRMRRGTHGLPVGMVRWIGVPSPRRWPRVVGPAGVEAGGHEDRAAGGVEVEHLGGVDRQPEAVLAGPVADGPAAAAEHGDVEGVDPGREQLLGRLAAVGGERGRPQRLRLRLGLADQPLQGPLAALADVGRDPGQGHDRAELGAAAGVGERGQVVLDPVVVAGQGGGAGQLHRPPGPTRPPQAMAGWAPSRTTPATAASSRLQRRVLVIAHPVPVRFRCDRWTGRAANRFPAW